MNWNGPGQNTMVLSKRITVTKTASFRKKALRNWGNSPILYGEWKRLLSGVVWFVLLIVIFGDSYAYAAAIDVDGQQEGKKIEIIRPVGCNSVSYAPIPGERDFFIARHFYDSGGSPSEGCQSDDVWGLVVAKLDWTTHRFAMVAPALPTPAVITGGQMKGAVIRSAYDADIVRYRGKYLVSFECSIKNKENYGIQGVSSCVGEFDPSTRKIDLNHTNVVISTEIAITKSGTIAYTASVPHLLVFNNRLYLYWSAGTVQAGKFVRLAIRGVELRQDDSNFYWVRGAGTLRYSRSPETSEVWAPDTKNALSNSSVDIRSLWSHNGLVIALASVGGGGCTNSLGAQQGCYRLQLARAPAPIGTHIFRPISNENEHPLPSNPMGYARLIRNREGNLALLALFRQSTQATSSGGRFLLDWNPRLGTSVLVAMPFMFPSLIPDEER